MGIPREFPTGSGPLAAQCGVVPPFLLRRLARSDDEYAARVARSTLEVERTLRLQREVRSARPSPGRHEGMPGFVPERLQRHPRLRDHGPVPETGPRVAPTTPAAPNRSVHDAQNGTTLPGVLVRGEGAEAAADSAVNEAYDGLGDTWSLFHEEYGRNSLDDAGLALVATVHFAREYDNAFWNGEQMVFGDGDGEIFGRFTCCPDVIGHELAHGFTQYTAGFVYVGQPGALNEHVSDVFGVLTRQRVLGHTAQESDWLIGAGLFMPGVQGVALRSMKEPGTAYDDPRLGKDPQPGHMDDYEQLPHDEKNDNGGVHINSGIPNRAFYLAATALGGQAWGAPGQIWYDTMTTGGLPKDADFGAFAAATLAAAQARYGQGSHEQEAVAAGWAGVGVVPQALPVHRGRPATPEAKAAARGVSKGGGSADPGP
ncbi:Zn-dependent metalloprotease [Kineosphaera limosa]|nr:M4 family metallopeptidase [Kineosphaera limosa]NYE02959.1 Zn-dependent metalloprotease [Kineosphaera limosa]